MSGSIAGLSTVQEALDRGDHQEVLRLTDAILAERPGDDAAHELRARALLALGRLDEAGRHAADAVRLDPDEIRYRELLAETLAAGGAQWYPGRPVLVTANDYDTGLFNGDIGVVVSRPEGIRVAFARGGPPTLYPPSRLSEVATVHAMTVHRGQGSQFRRVTVVLPPAESPLLTRELLYTAVTRATRLVQVFGSEAAIRRAVQRPANRASGLRLRLAR